MGTTTRKTRTTRQRVAAPTIEASAPDELRPVPVAKVRPSPYQPRKTFDEAELTELAASLAANGLLQPITVRVVHGADGEYYELIAGERRLRAAQKNGWLQVDAIVKTMTHEQAATLALVENLQRADLSPLEEAQAFKRLMTEHKLSQQALAARLGVARSSITDRLGLLELGPWLELLAKGEITVSQAVELRRYRALPLATQQAAIEDVRLQAGKDGIAALEVSTFTHVARRAFGPFLYPLTRGESWNMKPAFDTKAHDTECDCGRVKCASEYRASLTLEHCGNPAWWEAKHKAAEAERYGTRDSFNGRREWSDLGVTIEIPGARTVKTKGYGTPDGVHPLTDNSGRWRTERRGSAFDPADLGELTAEDLVIVHDEYFGGHYVGTTKREALAPAEARWEARWKAREQELREAAGRADFTLRGAGVREYLRQAVEMQDDYIAAAVKDVRALRTLEMPADVAAELADEETGYPGDLTRDWLATLPLDVAEAIATAYLRHAADSCYSDPLTQQVHEEERAEVERIRALPVPWVTARPTEVGGQRSMFDDDDLGDDDDIGDDGDDEVDLEDDDVEVDEDLDEDEDEEDDVDASTGHPNGDDLWDFDEGDGAAAPGTCIVCGCSDRQACEGGCAWRAYDAAAHVGVCSRCAPTLAAANEMLEAYLEDIKVTPPDPARAVA